MAIEGIPIKSLWMFIRWLPGFVLRRQFPAARLAQLMYVDSFRLFQQGYDDIYPRVTPSGNFVL